MKPCQRKTNAANYSCSGTGFINKTIYANKKRPLVEKTVNGKTTKACKFTFKPHMIVRIVPSPQSFQIMFRGDRDDYMEALPRRSLTTRATETTSTAWIELSSIQTIEIVSVG